MIEPWHWFVLGIILIFSEMFTMTFAFLWFGIAAIIVSTLLWLFPFTMPIWQVQALVWLIISALSVMTWFKFIQPNWAKKRTRAGLGGGVIIGETGMIVKAPMPNHSGTIRFRFPKVGSTEWQCRSEEDNIKMGDRVIVTNIIGNELIVKSMNQVNNDK